MAGNRRARTYRLVITCEHGGNRVPARYRTLLADHQALLSSHAGYDLGTLELARRFSRHFEAPLHCATVTRLLVELNRSEHHPDLFSSITRSLDAATRRELLERYYRPYRMAVRESLAAAVKRGERVIHLSIHSFTPVWRGEERRADIGLLYDPRRPGERQMSDSWRAELRRRLPELCVRRNYPYLGKADGQTTTLRKSYSPEEYVGIELEVNQKWPQKNRPIWQRLQMSIIAGFEATWRSL